MPASLVESLCAVMLSTSFPTAPLPNKKSAREASLPGADGRSVCAFFWELGTRGDAMKKRFLAVLEVARSSFRGLRSPLPRMCIWSVHAHLGGLAPALLQNTPHNNVARAPPEPPGDGPWTRPVSASQVRRGPERCSHGLKSQTVRGSGRHSLLQNISYHDIRANYISTWLITLTIRDWLIFLSGTTVPRSCCLCSGGARKTAVSSTGCLPLLQRQLRCRTTHVKNLCPLGSSPAGFSTTHILLVFSPLQPFALIDACGCIVTFSCPRKLFIPLLMVHCIGLNLLWE